LDYSSIKDCQSIIDAYDNSQCKFEDALALENRAKEIVASFPKGLSELELEKVIYKYIIDNIYYDDSPRKINAFGYDGIMNGRGVCGDYADAFTLLANYAGFEVYSCISETHAWNIVKIDGTYYHCDALWDEDVNQWNYFNRSTGFMMKIDHHTHDLLRYPICEQSMSVFDYCDVFDELE
jgi:transglutaminase/protease-like cytokinesis protein 3